MANKKMKTLDFGTGDVYENTPDWDKIDGLPFYEKELPDVALLDNLDIVFEDIAGDGSIGQYTGIGSIGLVEGAEYTVVFGNETYRTTCVLDPVDGVCVIGNMYLMEMGEDTGEPFIIGDVPEAGMFVIIATTAEPTTVSISGKGVEIRTLDSKYLPQHLQFGVTKKYGVLMSEQTLAFEGDGTPYITYVETDAMFISGETYEVTWNGELYHPTALGVEGMAILGNLGFLGIGANTGEPFIMMCDGEVLMVYAFSAGTVTCSIEGAMPIYTPLEKAYMPEHNHTFESLPDRPYVYLSEKPNGVILNTTENTVSENYAVAEGLKTTASGYASHAEGHSTTASGGYSHAEGYRAVASGTNTHAEGSGTEAPGYSAHAEGSATTASGQYSHAEGGSTVASGNSAHAEGTATKAVGSHSHAEGYRAVAMGDFGSHAEGYGAQNVPDTITKDTSIDDIIAAWKSNKFLLAHGQRSHAEGENTLAFGLSAHAEGNSCIARGSYSHAEGGNTLAQGTWSHAEGYYTKAEGEWTHAEGYETVATGYRSHAEGQGTIALGTNQHVQGAYNIADTALKYSHIVGNGASDDNRSNSHTLDKKGNAWFAGDVYIGGNGQYDGEGEKLVTETHAHPLGVCSLVDHKVPAITPDGSTLQITLTEDAVKILITSLVLQNFGLEFSINYNGTTVEVLSAVSPVVFGKLTDPDFHVQATSIFVVENTPFIIFFNVDGSGMTVSCKTLTFN